MTNSLLLALFLHAAAPVPANPVNPLPKGATARLGSLAFRGAGSSGVAFSADGRRLFASVYTRSFHTWDAQTGVLASINPTRPENLERFESVKAYVAGERIVWLARAGPTATHASEVIVTDFTGKVLIRFDIEGQPSMERPYIRGEFGLCDLSPDGRYFSTVFHPESRVETYDVNTGVRLHMQKFGGLQ